MNYCQTEVLAKGKGLDSYIPCMQRGSLFEDGRWWCDQHAPSVLAEQRRQAIADVKSKFAEMARADANNRARDAVIEAAKAWYVLDSQRDDDALTKAVQDLIRIEGETKR